MRYFYSKIDEVTMTHSDIVEIDGFDYVNIYFERPNDKNFDFLEIRYPGMYISKTYGFSETEIMNLEKYVKNNASQICRFARNGGGVSA